MTKNCHSRQFVTITKKDCIHLTTDLISVVGDVRCVYGFVNPVQLLGMNWSTRFLDGVFIRFDAPSRFKARIKRKQYKWNGLPL